MPTDQTVAPLLEQYRSQAGGLLPLLHAVQRALGYIPPESIPDIALAMNISRAEVHGVVTFYHDFRSAPAGRHSLQICRAEACQSMGSRELEDHARRKLAVDFGETTADGAVTLEAVYCLGNCACSPSVRIDDSVHARVDPAKLDALLAQMLE